ncbi:TfdA family taurine catabolism dioxygenase TauD [Nocardia ignorata]|uniref:TfdA family taurine catabolism dioxygenase TauD n=2 Tax=Nocardia ignorata TaxID=145285 RepID=A0A4R6PI17_NOCIG|nr:TfdA family taurine catabolism dioxygenase TauD [Nocardia ignorata]
MKGMPVQTTTDMRELAEHARCDRSPRSRYRDKLEQYGFVVLESDGNECLTLEDIMASLGEPVEYGYGTKLIQEQRPQTNNSQFRTGAIPMHADGFFNADGVRYIGLECLEAPPTGGETLIATSSSFFASAPSDLVARLRDIEIEYRSNVSGFYNERPDGNLVVAPIQVDPVTGGDALRMGVDYPEDPTRNFQASVVGYTRKQSLALFEQLDTVFCRPEVTYAHRWEVGQILIMDNLRVVHGRSAYPVDAPRKMVRISVS